MIVRPARGVSSIAALASLASLASLALLASVRPIGAQPPGGSTTAPMTAPTAVRTDPFCWRGRPLPRCHAFALLELGLYGAVASSAVRDPVRAERADVGARSVRTFGGQLSWTVGAMHNVDARSAIGGGAIVAIGLDHGSMGGAMLRARRWTGRSTSIEAGAGPVAVQVPQPIAFREFTVLADRWKPGVVGEVRANAADLGALSVRAVVVPRVTGGTQAALFAGASLGSTSAAIGTGLVAALTAFAIVAFARASY